MNQNLLTTISNEFHRYNKDYGSFPSVLIICDPNTKAKFIEECLEFTIKTGSLAVTEFMGAKVLYKNVVQYGGGCKWLLASS